MTWSSASPLSAPTADSACVPVAAAVADGRCGALEQREVRRLRLVRDDGARAAA